MDRSDVYRFIAHCKYGVVSSTGERGQPHSALVGIASTPECEIIFDTLNTSRKFGDLIRNPACSFVVGWEGEQTVQYEGFAKLPTGGELQRCQAIYFAVWPDGRTRMHSPETAYFVVRPTWLRYSVYNHQPPLIVEMTFP